MEVSCHLDDSYTVDLTIIYRDMVTMNNGVVFYAYAIAKPKYRKCAEGWRMFKNHHTWPDRASQGFCRLRNRA